MTFNNKREYVLMVAVVISVGAFITDRYIVPPFIERAKRIENLEKTIGAGKQLLARETALRNRWTAMRAWSIDNFSGAPGDNGADDTGGAAALAESNVFLALDRWSRESQLALTSLRPRWTDNEDDHQRLEFSAGAEGNLAAVAGFLYQLEQEEMAIHLEKVELASRDSRGQTLAMNVDFSGLVFKEDKK